MEEMKMKIHVHKSTREIKTVSGKEYITTYSVDKTDFADVKLSHSIRTKSASASNIEVFKELIDVDDDDFFIEVHDFTSSFITISRAATATEIANYKFNENSRLQNTEPPKSLMYKIGSVLGSLVGIAVIFGAIWYMVDGIINLLN